MEHEVRHEGLLQRRAEGVDQPCGSRWMKPTVSVTGTAAVRSKPRVVGSSVSNRRSRRETSAPVRALRKRRLARVRVAGEGDRRRPGLALLAPGPPLGRGPHRAQHLDAAADQAAVGLELRFARAPRADAAAEPLEVLPHAAQPGQDVVELRELDLELALALARLGEDVEDEQRCGRRRVRRARSRGPVAVSG